MSQNTMGRSQAGVRRSEYILERLVNSGEITEAGKNWLIAAYDPFHDGRIECAGYPDANGQDSVVQMVTETFTITAPTGYANNIDVHIVDFPFFGPITGTKPSPYTATSIYPDATGAPVPNGWLLNTSPLSNGNSNIGGIRAYVFEAGSGVDIFTGTVLAEYGVTLPNQYIQNTYRVIYKGWEVYNTTAELYKNGSVIVYKQPIQDYLTGSTAMIGTVGGPNPVGYFSICLMEAPPSTATEAMLLTNARQWDAREGVYVIPHMHSQIVPTNLGNYVQPMYFRETPGDGTMYTSGTPAALSSAAIAYNQNWMEFDQTGAIFQALTPQSTLTVNTRWGIESFPSSGSQLQTLAKPSPRHDPIALDLYSQLCHEAPIGVMVKFNGLGDWFNDAISSVASTVLPAVKTAAKLMGGGGMAGMAAKALGGGKAKKKR